MPPPATAEGLASRLFLGPALRTQPDRRLVTLVRAGYEAAFEEIVRRYGRPLGRYAASIVGGRSEDVTQDAFSKALLALRRSDAEIELRPWLFRIVRNTALNDLRDSPPSAELLAEAIAGGGDPAGELERREELADLIKRLQALPEPQRAAIVMRELEGLGHEEIANALGLSDGAARQAIYRARRALRDGAEMLVPLPLLQALLAGSGPGGAAEAAAGVAGVGGAGMAFKATAATVLVAGAVGAGVAIDHGARTGKAEATPPPGRARSAATSSSGEPGHEEAARLVDSSRRSDSSDGGRPGGNRSGQRDGSSEGQSGRSGPGGGSGAGNGGENGGRGSSHSGSSGDARSGSGGNHDSGGPGDRESGSGSAGRSGRGGDSRDDGADAGGGSGPGGSGAELESASNEGPGPGGEGLVEAGLSGDDGASGDSGISGGDGESHSGDSGSGDLLSDSHDGDGLSG
jgi:RNA polymerase sigma factor (sigma-70 family)